MDRATSAFDSLPQRQACGACFEIFPLEGAEDSQSAPCAGIPPAYEPPYHAEVAPVLRPAAVTARLAVTTDATTLPAETWAARVSEQTEESTHSALPRPGSLCLSPPAKPDDDLSTPALDGLLSAPQERLKQCESPHASSRQDSPAFTPIRAEIARRSHPEGDPRQGGAERDADCPKTRDDTAPQEGVESEGRAEEVRLGSSKEREARRQVKSCLAAAHEAQETESAARGDSPDDKAERQEATPEAWQTPIDGPNGSKEDFSDVEEVAPCQLRTEDDSLVRGPASSGPSGAVEPQTPGSSASLEQSRDGVRDTSRAFAGRRSVIPAAKGKIKAPAQSAFLSQHAEPRVFSAPLVCLPSLSWERSPTCEDASEVEERDAGEGEQRETEDRGTPNEAGCGNRWRSWDAFSSPLRRTRRADESEEVEGDGRRRAMDRPAAGKNSLALLRGKLEEEAEGEKEGDAEKAYEGGMCFAGSEGATRCCSRSGSEGRGSLTDDEFGDNESTREETQPGSATDEKPSEHRGSEEGATPELPGSPATGFPPGSTEHAEAEQRDDKLDTQRLVAGAGNAGPDSAEGDAAAAKETSGEADRAECETNGTGKSDTVSPPRRSNPRRACREGSGLTPCGIEWTRRIIAAAKEQAAEIAWTADDSASLRRLVVVGLEAKPGVGLGLFLQGDLPSCSCRLWQETLTQHEARCRRKRKKRSDGEPQPARHRDSLRDTRMRETRQGAPERLSLRGRPERQAQRSWSPGRAEEAEEPARLLTDRGQRGRAPDEKRGRRRELKERRESSQATDAGGPRHSGQCGEEDRERRVKGRRRRQTEEQRQAKDTNEGGAGESEQRTATAKREARGPFGLAGDEERCVKMEHNTGVKAEPGKTCVRKSGLSYGGAASGTNPREEKRGQVKTEKEAEGDTSESEQQERPTWRTDAAEAQRAVELAPCRREDQGGLGMRDRDRNSKKSSKGEEKPPGLKKKKLQPSEPLPCGCHDDEERGGFRVLCFRGDVVLSAYNDCRWKAVSTISTFSAAETAFIYSPEENPGIEPASHLSPAFTLASLDIPFTFQLQAENYLQTDLAEEVKAIFGNHYCAQHCQGFFDINRDNIPCIVSRPGRKLSQGPFGVFYGWRGMRSFPCAQVGCSHICSRTCRCYEEEALWRTCWRKHQRLPLPESARDGSAEDLKARAHDAEIRRHKAAFIAASRNNG
ncbi:hypothetical protein BESB_060640 [Besnoitia besnoiti]|uniref:Uncharacterized protein n=1 Tax=Besnoitia besnoiti TaxID=94643 RepID=A0A2A9MHV7_BESBE|nr:hypothetical protein BESB_060640 [Besnoitia besnoiti]PFH35177.1 hypothetical protein BESB_060640 [Besnoitia besnoiti]